MENDYALPKEKWGKEFLPDARDITEQPDRGDPCCRKIDYQGNAMWLLYTTETNNGYGYESDDFVNWRPFKQNEEGLLATGKDRAVWAADFNFYPDLANKGLDGFRAVISRGKGHGDDGHVGHNLELWTSRMADGPFTFLKRLTEHDFAIDSEVFIHHYTGEKRIAYARNFYDGDFVGTGIVLARISDDLTEVGEEIARFRAQADWQTYDTDRTFKPSDGLILPDKFWNDDRTEARVKRWYCLEGFAAGYVNKKGQPCYMYSAGRFGSDRPGLEYAVGVIVEESPDSYVDVSADMSHFLIRSDKERGIIDPGHGTVVKGPDGRHYFCCHVRRRPEWPRQPVFYPISETPEGLPFCELP